MAVKRSKSATKKAKAAAAAAAPPPPASSSRSTMETSDPSPKAQQQQQQPQQHSRRIAWALITTLALGVTLLYTASSFASSQAIEHHTHHKREEANADNHHDDFASFNWDDIIPSIYDSNLPPEAEAAPVIQPRARPPHLAQSFSTRDYSALSASSPQLSLIPKLTDPAPSIDHRSPTSFLSQILIPRVAGTANNTRVQRFITDIFEHELKPKPASPHGPARHGWTVERHSFEADTPEGRRSFTNIIATKEPLAPRKLILAAHFDSKFFRQGSEEYGFLGATDSAAPCAILIDTVRAVDALLDRRMEAREKTKASIAGDTTLQLVFFDGEEAFHAWTGTDSIYGARALASKWNELTGHEQVSNKQTGNQQRRDSERIEPRRYTPASTTPFKPVDMIEHFVLLDLLGAPNPAIPNYFDTTKWLYDHLASAERKLREAGLLMWGKEDTSKSFFGSSRSWGGIEDDHIPFAHLGVPIFHLIPTPFPSVWHKITDDASALDYPTMYAWSMLMRLFTIEYLGLEPYLKS